MEGSSSCPIAWMDDLYELSMEADKASHRHGWVCSFICPLFAPFKLPALVKGDACFTRAASSTFATLG